MSHLTDQVTTRHLIWYFSNNSITSWLFYQCLVWWSVHNVMKFLYYRADVSIDSSNPSKQESENTDNPETSQDKTEVDSEKSEKVRYYNVLYCGGRWQKSLWY